jgi:hypothetical protein
MLRRSNFSSFLAICAICLTLPVFAQGDKKKDPSTEETSAFAPGVLTVIPPAPQPEETYDGPQTLEQLVQAFPEIQFTAPTHPSGEPHYDPKSRTLLEMAKQVTLRHEVYCFEFSFKPLRHIYLDVPRADGRMQRKLVWYMVYRIRYRGGDLRPAADTVAGVPLYKRVESVHYQARSFLTPVFNLRDHSTGKVYTDTILPTTTSKIKTREQITTTLYNSVDITKVKIPYAADSAAPGVWGVATWDDVEPSIDFVSVEISGLTNAFEQDGVEEDSPYRVKRLQLNFYRPGDAIDQTADTIYFGVPAYENEQDQAYILKQYGLEERLDYRWVFR